MALEGGYFREQGLDGSVVLVGSGAPMLAALSNREIYEELRVKSDQRIFLVAENDYAVVFSNKSYGGRDSTKTSIMH